MTVRRRTPRALVAAPVLALLLTGVTACGWNDDVEPAEALDDAELQDAGSAVVEGVLGLEVLVAGNVDEVVANNAFRLDKDGLDPATATADGEDLLSSLRELRPGIDDPEAMSAYDEALADGTSREQTLVVVPRADLDLRAGDPVVVAGTLRRFDPEELEVVYDVEVDADAFAPYEDRLVVVAEVVRDLGEQ